jgi:hypothetical protein
MNRKQNIFAVGIALAASAASFGQDPGGGGQPPGNGQGNGNGDGNNVVLVPGFGGDSGGQQSQVDPIARYLMIKDAYRNNNFDVSPPIGASAKAQFDQEYYQKYAIALFDMLNAHRKRMVNEQSYIVKTIKDADRANRREQDQLTKDQTLAAKRNAFSRIVEAMNALPTPKAVVATGRPLNAYLERVNQAGSFGGLLAAGTDESFKLARPNAIRVSTGIAERSARMPIVGNELPFNPPAFLSMHPGLKTKLEAYQRARKEAAENKDRSWAVAEAQDTLTSLDRLVSQKRSNMKAIAYHDADYQESLAWKAFFSEERKLLNWLAANPSREDFNGKTVVDLLTYMRRNGFTFAAADPGDEDAYVALHQQLRDLCVKAADAPESGSDGRMEGFIKETDRLRDRLPPATDSKSQLIGIGQGQG